MALNTRRLYLSSVDSNIKFVNDGHVNFDLTRASIACRNDQMIALGCRYLEPLARGLYKLRLMIL